MNRTARRALATILFAVAASSPALADDRPAGPQLAEPAPLRVLVRGAPADDLRGRVEAELGTPTIAAEGSCDAPCLVISIERGQATVIFTPARGAPRARTVGLGGDPGQWPTVITLLAGNVVRDEADDVLAQLPPRPPRSQGEVPDPDVLDAATPMPIEPPSSDAPAIAVVPLAGARLPLAGARLPLAGARLDAPRVQRLIGFGLVPGLSTDFTNVGRIEHSLSVDILVGISGGSSGVTVSGIADIERGPVSGFQIGGITSIARRVSGVQLAGIASLSGAVNGVQVGGIAAAATDVDGAQIGGIAAVARRADTQIAGIAAVSGGRASWQVGGIAASAAGAANLQFGGIATFASGDTNMQVAGIASAARSANVQLAGIAVAAAGNANIQGAGIASVARSANVQVGGIATFAKDKTNIQVGGIVNVAGRVQGLQIAPINVARRVDGIQVGVINVGSPHGFSFGLINIVPGGRADVEATIDSSRMGTVLFRHGGRNWHNVYGIAGHPVDETEHSVLQSKDRSEDVWMYGLGFGPSWRAGTTVFDLELLGWEVNHGARHNADISILSQLRLSIAYGLGPFKIVAGGAINAYISDDKQSPLFLERRTESEQEEMTSGEVQVTWWPSAFVGLRI